MRKLKVPAREKRLTHTLMMFENWEGARFRVCKNTWYSEKEGGYTLHLKQPRSNRYNLMCYFETLGEAEQYMKDNAQLRFVDHMQKTDEIRKKYWATRLEGVEV